MNSELGPFRVCFLSENDVETGIKSALTSVVHLCDPEERCRGVQYRNLRPREDRTDDRGLLQCASLLGSKNFRNVTELTRQASITYIKQWENDTLEECAWFVHRLLQRLVIMDVQLLVGSNVFPDGVQQHNAEE